MTVKLICITSSTDPVALQKSIDQWVDEGANPYEGVAGVADEDKYDMTFPYKAFRYVGVTLLENNVFFSSSLFDFMTEGQVAVMINLYTTSQEG